MNTAVPFQAQKPIFHKLENIADMAQLTREERDFYHVASTLSVLGGDS